MNHIELEPYRYYRGVFPIENEVLVFVFTKEEDHYVLGRLWEDGSTKSTNRSLEQIHKFVSDFLVDVEPLNIL